MTDYAIGQRVRTLTDLKSVDWDPGQPDTKSGSLGTIVGLHYHPCTKNVWSYGVLLDADVSGLGVSLDPHEIEPA